MKPIKHSVFILSLCLFIFSNNKLLNAQKYKADFEKIEKFLSVSEKEGFQGSVLIADHSGVFKKGYGMADRENNIGIKSNTVFDIGSITKQFTGAAILKLEMLGKLSVDDKITKYFKDVPEDKKSITLHHLLTHSSGLPPYVGGDYEVLSRDDFLKKAFSKKLMFKPGKEYKYSNVGYSVLSAVIEIVSSQTYEEFLNEKLFLPAGMNQTGYSIPEWDTEDIAVGYKNEKEWGKPNEKLWDKNAPYWNLLGNGGILSTAEDLYKWHLALKTNDILDEPAKEKYYGRHIKEGKNTNSFYGYGWAIFPTPRKTFLVAHNGGNGIFFADFLRYLDEDITIIFMTNNAKNKLNDISYQIAASVFKKDYKFEINVKPDHIYKSTSEYEEGKIVEAFLTAVQEKNEEKIKKVIKEYFSEKLQNYAPTNKMVNMLMDLGNELKDGKIQEVQVFGFKSTIIFSNIPHELTLAIEEGKISGIDIEN